MILYLVIANEIELLKKYAKITCVPHATLNSQSSVNKGLITACRVQIPYYLVWNERSIEAGPTR